MTQLNPSALNDYLLGHALILQRCYRHWTGHDLVKFGRDDAEAAKQLFNAPFVVVSHDTADDPVFNYANKIALQLFEMPWPVFTALASRRSAEPMEREERARLLARVSSRGYINDYQGVRVSATGRRFLVENAMVWNLFFDDGSACGQAARFDKWTFL